MRKFIEQQLFEFDNAALIRVLKILCGAALLVILYAFVFSGFQIVDEFEHLHAAWLISVGKVPYLDFFEHHNPLLWYLSAPVVSIFYDNVSIFYVMRGMSFICSCLTVWYIYRIALFFENKAGAWFAVAFTLCNIITVYNFSQFRPDNYMNLFFIVGIYYWFCYLRTLQTRLLVYSFLSFTFSALFLQKISLLLIFVEVIMLFLIFKRKMQLKSATLAALPAVGLMFLFMGFLYFQGGLLEYIELNIHFNQAMVAYFERGAFWYKNLFLSIYGIALIVSFYLVRKENRYFKILAILYWAEFIMRGFYFAPHPNYYTLLTMLAALILSGLNKIIMPQHKVLCLMMLIGLFLYLGNIFNQVDRTSARHNSYTYYKMVDYIHQNSEPTDLLMNGYDKNFNVYRYDVSYYWFGLDMLLPVMEKEYGIENKIDINQLILQFRPKFIYTRDYVDLRALRTYGERKYSQKFIPEIINALYAPTPFESLVVLK
ncbi:MAG: glycosyltransferase family 39 protein [Acetobacter sp.]|nr:glycosyltransferase family 39 protein [Acetobacter sp.]